jgi:hypothetical protein
MMGSHPSSAPSGVANRVRERRVEVMSALQRLRFTALRSPSSRGMAYSTVSGSWPGAWSGWATWAGWSQARCARATSAPGSGSGFGSPRRSAVGAARPEGPPSSSSTSPGRPRCASRGHRDARSLAAPAPPLTGLVRVAGSCLLWVSAARPKWERVVSHADRRIRRSSIANAVAVVGLWTTVRATTREEAASRVCREMAKPPAQGRRLRIVNGMRCGLTSGAGSRRRCPARGRAGWSCRSRGRPGTADATRYCCSRR